MRGYTLTNVLDPADAQDVATKEYVDYVGETLKESLNTIDKRSHIIEVNASYSGHLRKNEFQFSFGGNEANNSTTGFLIPHSGRIKKIKMRTPISQDSFENAIARGRVNVPDFKNKGFFYFYK